MSFGVRAGFSRRRLLLTLMFGATAGAAASRSAAQQKVSQAEALYQDRPNNGFSCAACALFRPPAACVVVTGRVSAAGWCRFFDLPD
jgi:CO dehydrogenase/acetyl-CoA synthase beta subunit